MEYFVVQDDNIIQQLKGKTMTNLFRKLFRMNNELLLIREFIDSQVDKKKAVKYMIQQRQASASVKESLDKYEHDALCSKEAKEN